MKAPNTVRASRFQNITQPFSTNIFVLLLWIMTFILVASTPLLIAQSKAWKLMWDSARVHYVCWNILEGAVPYRDIFDTDMPGTYWIHLFVLKFMGGGDGAWRIFDLFCLLTIDALIILYCKPFGRLPAVLGATMFTSFHLYGGPLYAGQRDYFILVFILGGMYSVARHIETQGSIYFIALAGLLVGAAASIKPYAVVFGFFVFIIFCIYMFRLKKRWWLSGILFILSAAVIPGAIICWLWSIDGLHAFIDIIFNYLIPFYSKLKYNSLSKLFYHQFFGLPVIAELGLIVFLVLVDFIWQKRIGLRRLLLSVGILYGFIHYAAQGRNDYQLYPLILFTLLCAVSLYNSNTQNTPALFRIAVMAVLLHLSIGQTFFSIQSLIVKPRHHITGTGCCDSLVQDLRGRVADSETVQVMDFMSGDIRALFLLRCRQPTRFIYDFQFFHDVSHPYIQQLRKEFLDDLKRRSPAFFVVSSVSYPVEKERGFTRLQMFPELQEWLKQNYYLEKETDCYRLYRRMANQGNHREDPEGVVLMPAPCSSS